LNPKILKLVWNCFHSLSKKLALLMILWSLPVHDIHQFSVVGEDYHSVSKVVKWNKCNLNHVTCTSSATAPLWGFLALPVCCGIFPFSRFLTSVWCQQESPTATSIRQGPRGEIPEIRVCPRTVALYHSWWWVMSAGGNCDGLLI